LCTARVRRPSGFHPRPFVQLAISRNRLHARERPASLAGAFRRNFRRWFRAACAA
jgi:hypothetical protein